MDSTTNTWYVVQKSTDSKSTEIHRITKNQSSLVFSCSFWTGISECAHGRVIVHHFVAPDRPEPMGMDVYLGSTGYMIWSRPELIFQKSIDANRGMAVLKNHETFQYHVVDMATGKTISIYEPGEEPSLESFDSVGKSEENQISIYREGEADFSLIQKFIQQKEEKTINGLVEYLETDRLIVISYYIRASVGYINECCIYDLEGKRLSIEVLATQSDQLSLNTFMIHGQEVVMIKERKEVIFYEL